VDYECAYYIGRIGHQQAKRPDCPDVWRGLDTSGRSNHQLLHRLRDPLPLRLSARPVDAGKEASTHQQGLADAEKNKAELARTEALRQEVMAQANDQANRLIEEAHAAAARVQEREIQQAAAAAEQIIAKAREAADLERARMLAELKHDVGRLVMQTTAKVTRKVLTPEDEQRLNEETLQLTAG
jgi:F0F1-type ATP synthase membrane subunit b/b'